MAPECASIEANLARVRELVASACNRAGRSAEDVSIIAVAKKHPVESVRCAVAAMQLDIGESYVQEALAKQGELADSRVRWHFVGSIQSRKAKDIAGRFHLIHSLDSEKLARKLHNAAKDRGVPQPVLIQVNVGREEQKSGVLEEKLPELAETVIAFPELKLQGLMCLPPFFDAPDAAQPYFARLRQLRDDLERRLDIALPTLSMGMTGDFPQAIAEGATCVRIGTAIFGPRPY
ncbi:YggS family pyridoxal phosphate-dependent enzyme [Oceanidesulfovibrio indonesiensis]|uniref:Pyridoxal phosphate homeostasis protein n=1 Tax=Oceanidesulfovibrio indonesiensis TaxID=54767 RepID=A0A7M3MDI5_9BACT|nr:YggS family pyridoxal phosphate-dependent enzyme [Oceanidesulfovibrio indonesiensis]TVM16661.1 YggS family pyridoxal phosphate-dependent enzyme [Oceanidesulfovibrio indonesiensis]